MEDPSPMCLFQLMVQNNLRVMSKDGIAKFLNHPETQAYRNYPLIFYRSF